MSNQNQFNITEDTFRDLPEQTFDLVNDIGTWISNNSLGILIAAGAGTIIALILLALRSFGHRLIGDEGGDQTWRIVVGRALSKTSLFFIIMCSAELVAENAATPPTLLGIINTLFTISATIQAAVWARELILGIIQHRAGASDDQTSLGSAMGIIRLLVSIALFAIAAIVILDNLGVNVTGLVAGLGIGGIAIGLAAQGIFKDLFAALSIIFDKPFRKGESIRFGNISGSIEQIGLKTTRVRALSGEQVVVSNAGLLDAQIHNLTHLSRRRITLTVGVLYETPVETLRRMPEMIRQIVESHKDTKLVRCALAAFGASSLDFELQFDVHTTSYDYVFQTRGEIMIEMLEAFAREGIGIAYPTQVSYTAAPDGKLIMPYPEVQPVHIEDGRD